MEPQTQKRKRNFFIPYIKGWAIISIMLIHLIDWSNITVSLSGSWLKELLYPSVLFFIANAGSVVYIAYGHYELEKSAKKLIRRGAELIGIYFIYNISKFLIFDFQTEPFYSQFHFFNLSDIWSIVSLKAFSVPITILFTIGLFLLFAIILLAIVKKSSYPKIAIVALLVFVAMCNWLIPHGNSFVFTVLYSQGFVFFPFMLWLIPFILGFLVAQYEFEKYAMRFLTLFLVCTVITIFLLPNGLDFIRPSWNMYPLKLYYVWFSFAFMYVLIILFKKLQNLHLLLKPLAVIRFLGDTTLSLYIYHWIVVDITLWLFFPAAWSLWITVPLFLLLYLCFNRDTLLKYFAGEM